MQPHIFFQKGNDFVRVNISDIVCLEAASDDVAVTTLQGIYFSNLPLKEFEKMLPVESFCRVSESGMVSYRHIISFDLTTISLSCSKRLFFSEEYRAVFEASFKHFGVEPINNNN
jgi:DNA-binding LytR/AlgR family response regulator